MVPDAMLLISVAGKQKTHLVNTCGNIMRTNLKQEGDQGVLSEQTILKETNQEVQNVANPHQIFLDNNDIVLCLYLQRAFCKIRSA